MTLDESRADESSDSGTYPLADVAEQIIARLDRLNSVRDESLSRGRQIIRLSANAIRSLHRNEAEAGFRLLEDARRLLNLIKDETGQYPSIYWAGYVQDAMKEFAEAAITGAMLGGRPIPNPESLGVEDGPYLNALAEAASELRRDTLDALRADDIERAAHLMRHMDDIYAVLVAVDFPDAITGGLRRTTDQLRAVLERTRGDLTVALRQHRLERALDRVENAIERKS